MRMISILLVHSKCSYNVRKWFFLIDNPSMRKEKKSIKSAHQSIGSRLARNSTKIDHLSKLISIKSPPTTAGQMATDASSSSRKAANQTSERKIAEENPPKRGADKYPFKLQLQGTRRKNEQALNLSATRRRSPLLMLLSPFVDDDLADWNVRWRSPRSICFCVSTDLLDWRRFWRICVGTFAVVITFNLISTLW